MKARQERGKPCKVMESWRGRLNLMPTFFVAFHGIPEGWGALMYPALVELELDYGLRMV